MVTAAGEPSASLSSPGATGQNGKPPLIVGIGGTQRPGSSSERALLRALAAAERAGARAEVLDATALEMPMYLPSSAERTANARRLVELVRAADGLVIASPGYHGGVSGLVKNALDYIEDLRDDRRPYLEGRAVGCIVCAAGWQATVTALSSLRSTVHALRGWPTPLGVAVNSQRSEDRPGDPLEAAAAHLDALADQVVEFASLTRLRAEVRP